MEIAGNSIINDNHGNNQNIIIQPIPDGNVGIGTSLPPEKLSVGGNIQSSGNIIAGIDSSKGVILTSPNGTKFRVTVSNAGALSVSSV